MGASNYHEAVRRVIEPYRIADGRSFRLKRINPADTAGIKSKPAAKELLARGVAELRDLHEKLYAQSVWAVLIILQGMDASGKDSTIEHVMSGVNPQGCEVTAFKVPSAEELAHDFLWRTTRRLPERGRIGIFNRSYYEEVLVVRVHPALLAKQSLPAAVMSDKLWAKRFDDINEFERHLHRNGVLVLKFFLHVSKEEQRKRFLERLDQPHKQWKFSVGDVQERSHWDEYMAAYEDMIRHTATKSCPWHVIPADHKWFSRLAVAAELVTALASLDLSFPKMDAAKRKELAAAREMLEAEAR
jgi:PPK2 family polyphosphate:nucleotide phosphotransferase